MSFEQLKAERHITDAELDAVFPPKIKSLSERHWTPVIVAKIASNFLCHKDGLNILDIGCGVGKFCLVAATLQPHCNFHGIDIRENFIKQANKTKHKFNIANSLFSCQDILETDINGYDCIYFFNSFQENIDETSIMDEESRVSHEMFKIYTQHLYDKFSLLPAGTRLVTYHTAEFCIPDNFKIVERHLADDVKCYIKSKSKKAEPEIDEDAFKKHIMVYGS